MPIPTLTGEAVVLREVRPQDESSRKAHGWHSEIERNYGRVRASGPMSDEEARDWYSRQLALSSQASRVAWVIEADNELAGVAFLHSISEVDSKARFAIGMFAPQFIRRGLGSDSTRQVLRYAFEALDLHRLDLRVLAFNRRAISAYRRCGFVEEGRERESCWLDGLWHDDVIMGILVHEFIPQAG